MALCEECKAAICCAGVAAKIQKIDQLLIRGKIKNPETLAKIIECSEEIDDILKDVIEEIRNNAT